MVNVRRINIVFKNFGQQSLKITLDKSGVIDIYLGLYSERSVELCQEVTPVMPAYSKCT